MEEEAYFINTFIDMPMAATPHFVVDRFFDFIEPFFRACIHGAMVNAGKKYLYDNDEIKAYFNEIYQQMKRTTILDMGNVIYPISKLVYDHEKTRFY